jgi:hypothetical protein
MQNTNSANWPEGWHREEKPDGEYESLDEFLARIGAAWHVSLAEAISLQAFNAQDLIDGRALLTGMLTQRLIDLFSVPGPRAMQLAMDTISVSDRERRAICGDLRAGDRAGDALH